MILTNTLYCSFGKPRTDRIKLAKVEAAKLWDCVLDRRAKDTQLGQNMVISDTMSKLHEAGLEDPYEITESIRQHVSDLVQRYQPTNQLETAILIFRSLIPSGKQLFVNNDKYNGLKTADGGLEIVPSVDKDTSLRKKYGSVLPKDLLSSEQGERTAICLEYSFLMTVLLRAAGIKAKVKEERERKSLHASVIAVLDGAYYHIDPTLTKFNLLRNDESTGNSDRHGIAMHYANKGSVVGYLGGDEIQYFHVAIELNPNDPTAWNNRGITFYKQGELEKAERDFDEAIRLEPEYATPWLNKGKIHFDRKEYEKAIICLERATILKGSKESFLYLALALNNSGRENDALQFVEEVLQSVGQTEPEFWHIKACILADRNDPESLSEALICCHVLLDLQPANQTYRFKKAEIQIKNNDIWPAMVTLAEILEAEPNHEEARAEQGKMRAQLLSNIENRGNKGPSAYRQLAELAARFDALSEVEYWKLKN